MILEQLLLERIVIVPTALFDELHVVYQTLEVRVKGQLGTLFYIFEHDLFEKFDFLDKGFRMVGQGHRSNYLALRLC